MFEHNGFFFVLDEQKEKRGADGSTLASISLYHKPL